MIITYYRHRSVPLVYKLLELESKCAEYLGYLRATRSPHVTNVTICLRGSGPGLGPAKIISSINIADNEDNDRDDRNCTGAGGGEEDGSGHQTLLSTRPIMTESGNNFLIIDPGTSPSLIQSKIWTIIIHSIHSNDIV